MLSGTHRHHACSPPPSMRNHATHPIPQDISKQKATFQAHPQTHFSGLPIQPSFPSSQPAPATRMKSTLFTSLLVAIPPANAAAILPAQHPLPSPDTQEAKVKVPGHNSAYYTQIAASEQLFGVRELVVYPNPPRL